MRVEPGRPPVAGEDRSGPIVSAIITRRAWTGDPRGAGTPTGCCATPAFRMLEGEATRRNPRRAGHRHARRRCLPPLSPIPAKEAGAPAGPVPHLPGLEGRAVPRPAQPAPRRTRRPATATAPRAVISTY